MKKVKIIAAALIASCAFEYAIANTGINSFVRVISHKDHALRDTVPVTSGSGSKTPSTAPMPTPTPMPPAPTPTTPSPSPTPAPTPTTPTTPPAK